MICCGRMHTSFSLQLAFAHATHVPRVVESEAPERNWSLPQTGWLVQTNPLLVPLHPPLRYWADSHFTLSHWLHCRVNTSPAHCPLRYLAMLVDAAHHEQTHRPEVNMRMNAV